MLQQASRNPTLKSKIRHAALLIVLFVFTLGITIWWNFFRSVPISAAIFQKVYTETQYSSFSAWRLYGENETVYYLRYSAGAPFERRFRLSKSEVFIDISNGFFYQKNIRFTNNYLQDIWARAIEEDQSQ